MLQHGRVLRMSHKGTTKHHDYTYSDQIHMNSIDDWRDGREVSEMFEGCGVSVWKDDTFRMDGSGDCSQKGIF